MRRRNGLPASAVPILGFVLVLFCLNTISHDFFCHEELQGVCNPLHFSSTVTEPVSAAAMSPSPRVITSLSGSREQAVIPGFIKNIFHPPD